MTDELWYQTIELGNGSVSKAVYDHRSVVECYGIPQNLDGKSCLDVGTADGFFAFEMERRGASRVVAIDIADWKGYDWLPEVRDRLQPPQQGPHRFKFQLARDLRKSRVEHSICSVYDLCPHIVGTFDVVFCGSLLLHLQNPLRALLNIRSVTRQMAIIETQIEPELDERFPDRPWMSFGHRQAESNHQMQLGESAVYWLFSTRALEEMLKYAGFPRIDRQRTFKLPAGDAGWFAVGPPVTAVVAYTTP